jgi:hypothetical protein
LVTTVVIKLVEGPPAGVQVMTPLVLMTMPEGAAARP